MIKIRSERPIKLGELCQIKDNVLGIMKNNPSAKRYNISGILRFNTFLLIRDNVSGQKGLSIIIPIKHNRDNNPFNYVYMIDFLKKKKTRRFVVYTETLSRTDETLKEIYISKNEAQLNNFCVFINDIQLKDELIQLTF